MFGIEITTKTETTKTDYQRKIKTVTKSIKTYSDVIPYFESKKNDWSRASFRGYKAAFVWHLEEVISSGNHTEEVIDALRHLLYLLKTMASKDFLKKGTKGASFRSKSISEEEYNLLIKKLNEMHRNGSELADITAYIFSVNVYLGLRPCEWGRVVDFSIKKSSGKYIIEIKNAKNTNGRAHGPTRKIELSGFNKISLMHLNRVLQIIKGWSQEGLLEKRFRTISARLRKARREIWPRQTKKNITIYSTRHQFAANAKKTVGHTACAALLGQKSNTTCASHYGKVTKGKVGLHNGEMAVRADKGDLDRIVEYDRGIKNFLKRKNECQTKHSYGMGY